jgi:hypothetical protein
MCVSLPSAVVSGFEQMAHDLGEPKSGAWRRLDPPVTVRAYFANQWHDSVAVDVNDDTREVRIEMPPVPNERGVDVINHKVLNAGLYQAPGGTLAR